jgi:hypothetical protein
MRKRFGTNEWRVLRLASGAQRGKAGERDGERTGRRSRFQPSARKIAHNFNFRLSGRHRAHRHVAVLPVSLLYVVQRL